MTNVLENLEPKKVWKYFEEICKIPRPSKKEQKILKYLQDFAESHDLKWEQDKAGNIVIKKDGCKNMKSFKTVVLQSHVDMITEKNSDVKHDFDNDPIRPVIDDGWVKASGTTLGADNGIGMALQLALLESNDIEHGNIECLFTVDEETGLTGAFALDKEMLDGKILLNLDSEDEGELFIGCAGGINTSAIFNFEKEKPQSNNIPYKISVAGFKGGHSGDDIDKHRGNAIKILNRLLWNCEKMFDISLAKFAGGNMHNAIPREANAIISVPSKYEKSFEDLAGKLALHIKSEFKTNEPKLSIEIEKTDMPDFFIDNNTKSKFLNAIYACPHGVIRMSPDIPNFVETSTNLAVVKTTNNEILITTSQRSSYKSSKKDTANMVGSAFELAGAKVKYGDGYPGWIPNMNSEILRVSKESYKKLFNKNPKVLAIHAGLECGVIGEKYPEMDMISFGPTIKGAHSPDERLEIDTVPKFWELTLEILKNIPSE